MTLTDHEISEAGRKQMCVYHEDVNRNPSWQCRCNAIDAAMVAAVNAALRTSRERERRYESLLRRYHERVTAADNLLTGIIASRGHLNDAMSTLPHPTIGDEVSAALAPMTNPNVTTAAMELHDVVHMIYRDPSCVGCQEAQRILDAYAADRIEDRQRTIIEMLGAEPHTYEQIQAERDAAIARAEAAEAERDNIAREALQAIVAQQRAEERVRVLTDAMLAEIEARAKATTPGPWAASQYLDDGRWGVLADDNEIVVGVGSRLTKEGAAFIAAARSDIPTLIAALRDALAKAAAAEGGKA